MNNQPDLDSMTIVELKALVYDQLSLLEQAQNNLKVINQKIAEKSQEKPKAEKPKE